MDLKERIFASIGKESMPIFKIAESADVCTTTCSKYCYILQAENKIVITGFGNMKLVKRK